MFRCVIHHLQGEHRITCSELSTFYNVVYFMFFLPCIFVVCATFGVVTEHKIHNIFRDLKLFFSE